MVLKWEKDGVELNTDYNFWLPKGKEKEWVEWGQREITFEKDGKTITNKQKKYVIACDCRKSKQFDTNGGEVPKLTKVLHRFPRGINAISVHWANLADIDFAMWGKSSNTIKHLNPNYTKPYINDKNWLHSSLTSGKKVAKPDDVAFDYVDNGKYSFGVTSINEYNSNVTATNFLNVRLKLYYTDGTYGFCTIPNKKNRMPANCPEAKYFWQDGNNGPYPQANVFYHQTELVNQSRSSLTTRTYCADDLAFNSWAAGGEEYLMQSRDMRKYRSAYHYGVELDYIELEADYYVGGKYNYGNKYSSIFFDGFLFFVINWF